MRHGGSFPETHGDVSIWGLLESQTEAIIDIRFGDTDADSWKPFSMDKLLTGLEKLKKDKHGQACYNQRRNIYPFFSQWMGLWAMRH